MNGRSSTHYPSQSGIVEFVSFLIWQAARWLVKWKTPKQKGLNISLGIYSFHFLFSFCRPPPHTHTFFPWKSVKITFKITNSRRLMSHESHECREGHILFSSRLSFYSSRCKHKMRLDYIYVDYYVNCSLH